METEQAKVSKALADLRWPGLKVGDRVEIGTVIGEGVTAEGSPYWDLKLAPT